MHTHIAALRRRAAWSVALAALAAGSAAGARAQAEAVPAPAVQQANGVDYVNGGVGLEARERIDALRGRFPLRIEFSGAGGAYVVAERVSVQGPEGELVGLQDVGPILMIDLPPGRYTIEAQVQGRAKRKSVEVGSEARTVAWVWPQVGG